MATRQRSSVGPVQKQLADTTQHSNQPSVGNSDLGMGGFFGGFGSFFGLGNAGTSGMMAPPPYCMPAPPPFISPFGMDPYGFGMDPYGLGMDPYGLGPMYGPMMPPSTSAPSAPPTKETAAAKSEPSWLFESQYKSGKGKYQPWSFGAAQTKATKVKMNTESPASWSGGKGNEWTSSSGFGRHEKKGAWYGTQSTTSLAEDPSALQSIKHGDRKTSSFDLSNNKGKTTAAWGSSTFTAREGGDFNGLEDYRSRKFSLYGNPGGQSFGGGYSWGSGYQEGENYYYRELDAFNGKNASDLQKMDHMSGGFVDPNGPKRASLLESKLGGHNTVRGLQQQTSGIGQRTGDRMLNEVIDYDKQTLVRDKTSHAVNGGYDFKNNRGNFSYGQNRETMNRSGYTTGNSWGISGNTDYSWDKKKTSQSKLWGLGFNQSSSTGVDEKWWSYRPEEWAGQSHSEAVIASSTSHKGGVSLDFGKEIYGANYSQSRSKTTLDGTQSSWSAGGNMSYDAKKQIFSAGGNYSSSNWLSSNKKLPGYSEKLTEEEIAERNYSSRTIGGSGAVNFDKGAFKLNLNESNYKGVSDGKGGVAKDGRSTRGTVGYDSSTGAFNVGAATYTQDAKRAKTGLGFDVAYDPSTNSGSWGIEGAHDGVGGNLGAYYQDGKMTGAKAGIITKDYGLGFDVNLTKNTTKLGLAAKYKGIGAGFGYENVDSLVTSGVKSAQDSFGIASNSVDRAMGGQDYFQVNRQDRFALDASLGTKSIGGGAGYETESNVSFFSSLPDNWSQMTPEEQKAWQKSTSSRLNENIGGIADIDLANIAEGEGFRINSSDGWRAHAGGVIGPVGINGSVNSSTASETTISNDGGMLTVNMRTADNMGGSGGLSAFGLLGASVGGQGGDVEEFSFQVDPNNPEAMAALQAYTETGVLPGAQNIQSEEGQEQARRFGEAQAEISRLETELEAAREAAANAPTPVMMAGPGAPPPPSPEQMRVTQLMSQLSTQNGVLNDARNGLNAEWKRSHQVGGQPVPGVTVNRTRTEEMAETNVSLTAVVGFEVWADRETRAKTDFLDNKGQKQTEYAWENEERGLFSNDETTYSRAVTGGKEWGWSMGSRAEIDEMAEYDIVRRVNKGDVPDFLMDAKENRGEGVNGWAWRTYEYLQFAKDEAHENLMGRTEIELKESMVMQMGENLNKGDGGADLWKSFAQRTAQYWEHDQMMREQANSGYGDPGHIPPIPPSVAQNVGLPKGTTSAELAKVFSSVTSPDDFMKLPAEQQSAFIDTILRSGGKDHNPYEALAAISLIKDDSKRAQELTGAFEDIEEHGMRGTGHNDPVMLFIDFQERFSDDAKLGASLSKAISFELDDKNVDKYEKMTRANQSKALIAAMNATSGFPWHQEKDPDEQQMLDVVRAARNKGGAEAVDELLALAAKDGKTDIRAMFNAMEDDPERQLWMSELLEGTALGKDVLEDKDLMNDVSRRAMREIDPPSFVNFELKDEDGNARFQIGDESGFVMTVDPVTGDNVTKIGGRYGYEQTVNLLDGHYAQNIGGKGGLGYDFNLSELNFDVNLFGNEIDIDEGIATAANWAADGVSNLASGAVELGSDFIEGTGEVLSDIGDTIVSFIPSISLPSW